MLPKDDHQRDIATLKHEARTLAQRVRKQAHAKQKQAESAALQATHHALDALNPTKGQVVSLFLSIGSEINTVPLMEALWQRGCQVVLPCVVASAQPLIFRLYQDGDDLIKEAFGTMAPAASAPILIPDLMIVPLLAFDRQGYRLGYGGGFYDRTLDGLQVHKHPVVTAGFAYAAQEVENVPREVTDQPLDWMMTEEGAFKV